jgi:transcription initiation factor TFIIH subunit 2
MEGDDTKNYAWEQAYKRSWDVLQEDESGSLDKLILALQSRKKKKAYES